MTRRPSLLATHGYASYLVPGERSVVRMIGVPAPDHFDGRCGTYAIREEMRNGTTRILSVHGSKAVAMDRFKTLFHRDRGP